MTLVKEPIQTRRRTSTIWPGEALYIDHSRSHPSHQVRRQWTGPQRCEVDHRRTVYRASQRRLDLRCEHCGSTVSSLTRNTACKAQLRRSIPQLFRRRVCSDGLDRVPHIAAHGAVEPRRYELEIALARQRHDQPSVLCLHESPRATAARPAGSSEAEDLCTLDQQTQAPVVCSGVEIGPACIEPFGQTRNAVDQPHRSLDTSSGDRCRT